MHRFRSRWTGALCVLIAVAMAASGCSSSSKNGTSSGTTAPTSSPAGGANGSSAPGVTPSKVTVGLVTDLTGVEAAQFNGARQGVDARFRLQNSEGGVDGRQLELAVSDDVSNPQGAQTAVSELISQKNVFGLMFVSGVTATAYKVPQQQGIPVVGAPVDGVAWGTQPNTNMFSVGGNEGPTGLAVSTVVPTLMKIAGATNVASLGYGNEPASSIAAKGSRPRRRGPA